MVEVEALGEAALTVCGLDIGGALAFGTETQALETRAHDIDCKRVKGGSIGRMSNFTTINQCKKRRGRLKGTRLQYE